MSFEASGLEINKPYEFWVTASTNIGEGQQSKSIIAIPNDKVPAKIASFDDTFIATFKEDAKLPCLAVGSPTPNITWKVRYPFLHFFALIITVVFKLNCIFLFLRNFR